MSDSITTPVNGETPEVSQTEQKTPESILGDQDVTGVSSPPTPEIPKEAQDWASLSGSTQERIRELIRERNDALDKVKTVPSVTEQPTGTSDSPEDVNRAVKVLKEHGLATMEDVNAILARIQTNQIHDNLARKYSGTDGLPSYNREEVEDFAKRKSIWDLEAAYKTMYFDEFMDHARTATKRKVVGTEKPTSSSPERKEPLTVESFRAKLRNPDGSLNMAEYERLSKDPGKLDALLQEFARTG